MRRQGGGQCGIGGSLTSAQSSSGNMPRVIRCSTFEPEQLRDGSLWNVVPPSVTLVSSLEKRGGKRALGLRCTSVMLSAAGSVRCHTISIKPNFPPQAAARVSRPAKFLRPTRVDMRPEKDCESQF